MTAEAAIRRALQLRDGVVPNRNLTPAEAKEKYENCPVVLSDSTITRVRIHKYRIDRADPDFADPNKRILDQDADAELRHARGHLRRWCQQDGEVSQELRNRIRQIVREGRLTNTFSGKGSPKDMSLFLTTLSISGRIRDALPASAAKPERLRIEDYADRFVGVDCSGFVNNFFIASAHYSDNLRNRNMPIRRYGQQINRFHFLPDRPQSFMLVWESMRHIAAIQDWGPGSWISGSTLRVIESAASFGGLRNSLYDIVRPPELTEANPVWQVRRREQPGGGTHRVFMVAPLPPV